LVEALNWPEENVFRPKFSRGEEGGGRKSLILEAYSPGSRHNKVDASFNASTNHRGFRTFAFDIVALMESRKFTASEKAEPGKACQLQMSHGLVGTEINKQLGGLWGLLI